MTEVVDGRYELLEVLASGGMATVWRARDNRLDRSVALKRPHPAPAGDPTHTRMEREARAAAGLNHPHLVTVYDSGVDESGPFIVMELIDGPSLAEAGAGLEPAEAVETGAVLADALAAVHAAGIVHRDVKPANILMSDRGPQLTDFGIARSDMATLTQPGAVMGTLSFVAPEVLAGQPPGPESDVFSLGVVVYELVTGRLPFEGTDRSTSPPPTGDPQLDSILAQALAPDPGDRPDASRLASALRAHAPTRAVPIGAAAAAHSTAPMAVPVPTAAEPGKGRSRSKAGLLAVGALALVSVAAFAVISGGDDTVTAVTVTPESAATTAVTLPPTTPPTTVPPTTVLPTTFPPTTVLPTTVPSTTVEPVTEARRALIAVLNEALEEGLASRDAEDILRQADSAIDRASQGDEDRAGRDLGNALRRAEDRLDDPYREGAVDAIEQLASALEVDIERRGNDDDED